MDNPLLTHLDKSSATMTNEIKADLEVTAKIEAMKHAVTLPLNGETLPTLFITTVVRYVLPSEDHTIQKLLLLYLETVDKRNAAGRLLPEMIPIGRNLRSNLQHPNEHVRVATLRLLCRLAEPEELEPLVPSVLVNLEHRHHLVRCHALSAVLAIHRLPQGCRLIPDAASLASSEQDSSARRNAFLVLCLCGRERAMPYLLSNAERVTEWPDLLQMAAVDLIGHSPTPSRAHKGGCVKIIISLLNSPSVAVAYESAGDMASLSSAPIAVRVAANTYCHLLSSQSDDNVRLVLLDRLNELQTAHRDVIVDVVMDVVRALASHQGRPSLDVKRKELDLVLDLLTPRNVEEVVLYLNKEVAKTQSS